MEIGPERQINVIVEYKLEKWYKPLTDFSVKGLVLATLLEFFTSTYFRAHPSVFWESVCCHVGENYSENCRLFLTVIFKGGIHDSH